MAKRGHLTAVEQDESPAPPALLTDRPPMSSKVARDLWDTLAPEMQRAGLLTVSSRLLLERYCKLFAKWRKAEQLVSGDFMRDGRTSGETVKHPLCQMTVQWSTECRHLERTLGLDRLEARGTATTADPARYLTQ